MRFWTQETAFPIKQKMTSFDHNDFISGSTAGLYGRKIKGQASSSEGKPGN